MKSRWYLAAFPAALLGCSSPSYYGPAPASGGAPTSSGGYANVGGNQSGGAGSIDTGVPTGHTGGAMSVRYGPVSSLSP